MIRSVFSKLKHNFTVTKPDRVDVMVLCFLLGFGWLIVDIAHKPASIIHTITIIVIVYFIIRTLYERVWNRTNVPTLESGVVLTAAMTELVKQDFLAKQKQPYHIVDVGSGDGQLTRALARGIPKASVLGLEHGAMPFAHAMFYQKIMPLENLHYRKGNFFDYDFKNVDTVVMYLSIQMAQRVGEKLFDELKTGALVLSNEFELKGKWQTPETLERFTPFKKTIYIYRKL